jgi:hypothetical protein
LHILGTAVGKEIREAEAAAVAAAVEVGLFILMSLFRFQIRLGKL